MRFVKKPETLDAIQWSGSNWHACLAFAEEHGEPRGVYTDGKDLYIRGQAGTQKEDKLVPVGAWVAFRSPFEGLFLAGDEALHDEWEEIPE